MAKAGLLYVGTDDGLVLFSDPGAQGRWLRIGHALHGGAVPLVWTQADAPLVVLAVTGAGLQRSEDGGRSWEVVLADHVSAASTAFALLPGKEPALLAASGTGGIARSTDGGATWSPTDVDQPWNGSVAVIAAAGYHIDTAFAGTSGGQVAISTDRGRSWHVLRADLPAVRSVVSARLD